MSDNKIHLSSYLIKNFDQKFEVVTKNGKLVPFSVDIILKDLLDTGLSPIEALDILQDIEPHLVKGIENRKIIQLINQSLQGRDIGRTFIKSNYLQPILIVYDDDTSEIFNFRAIKDFLKDILQNFEYTSKTFKAFSEELYRIVLSLRSDKLKISVLKSMVPSVLRNVIGLNPFSKSRIEEDYYNIMKLSESLFKTWDFLPNSEKITLISSMFESFYKIILLHYNYLPGYNLRSTITQVNQLIAELTENPTHLLSDKEIYQIGKSSRIISELLDKQEIGNDVDKETSILEFIRDIQRISDKFAETGSITWLIIIDQSGNELFARFSFEEDQKYQSLLGMAISGVQSLVNELTDREIQKIEHEEGSIIIERDHLFSIITMVDVQTPVIQREISKLADFLRSDLRTKLENFRGKVSGFDKIINDYIKQNMQHLFIIK